MLLVTGATGFIGSHLLERVSGPVAVIPDVTPGQAPPRARRIRPGGSRHRRRRRRGPARCRHRHPPGRRHQGAATRGLLAGNARATETLARAAAGRGIRFVHVSSLAAAGPSPDAAPIDEDAPPRPVSHYGRSKLKAEQVVRALVPDAVIVRPPVVYGPRDTGVLEMFRSVARGFVARDRGRRALVQAIYVEDLAEGLLAALASPRRRPHVLPDHAKAVSWSELSAAARARHAASARAAYAFLRRLRTP